MTVERDPEYEVRRQAIEWNNSMECIPTWDEILEVEYVRQRGEINMITDDVIGYCASRGLFNAVGWLWRCKEAHLFWGRIYDQVMPSFEKERGPRDGWVTDNVRDEFLELEYKSEEIELEQKRKDLAQKRRALTHKRGAHGAGQR